LSLCDDNGISKYNVDFRYNNIVLNEAPFLYFSIQELANGGAFIEEINQELEWDTKEL
jgi:hypothetical protein